MIDGDVGAISDATRLLSECPRPRRQHDLPGLFGIGLAKRMSPGLRERLARLRGFASRDESPHLARAYGPAEQHPQMGVAWRGGRRLRGPGHARLSMGARPVSRLGASAHGRSRSIFPALVAGIVAHLVCGVRPPFPALQDAFADTRQVKTILIMLACGALFGLIALLLIESLRFSERTLRRFERRPYVLSAGGGIALVLLYWSAGDTYTGLGTDTINGVLAARRRSSPARFFSRSSRPRSRVKREAAAASSRRYSSSARRVAPHWHHFSACRRRS